jgi:double-stranded uracil-DNA glycosylase
MYNKYGDYMIVNHEFGPVYDQNSTILILGSIPSSKSRQAGFYYAHPQNRFWSIINQLYHLNLITISDKKSFLINNHIALWDTIYSCEITGSSDSSIKKVKVNNIKQLINKTQIKYIYCTGKVSYNIYNKYIYPTTLIKAAYLPSPSPANAKMTLDELVKIYNIILTK